MGKPLPSIPNRNLSATDNDGVHTIEHVADLTPPAQSHVRKVILQALSEESLPASWASPIQSAIESVGLAIWEQGWTNGLVRARDFRRARMLASYYTTGIASVPPGANDDKDSTRSGPNAARNLASSRAGSLPSVAPGSPRRLRAPKLRGQELQEVNARALSELQRLANMSNVMDYAGNPPSDSMLHLLLTIVFEDAPDPHPSSPTPGPDSINIHFVRGEYVTPDQEGRHLRKHESAIDVSGVESWKSLFRACTQEEDAATLRSIVIVGGKLVVTSVDGSQRDPLAKVLRLTLYTQLLNLLELSLLRSTGAEIIYPPPPSPPSRIPGSFPEPPLLPDHLPLSPIKSNDTIRPPQPKSRRSRFSGAVWGFLTKTLKPPSPAPPLPLQSRPHPHPHPHSPNALAHSFANAIVGERHHLAVPPNTRSQTEDAISRLAIGMGMNGTGSGGTTNTNGAKMAPVVDPFTTAVNGMRSDTAVFSTSYSVRFEPPETLLRLAKSEVDESVSSTSGTVATTVAISKSRPSTAASASTSATTGTTQPSSSTNTTGRKRRRVTGADKVALSSILGWRPDGSGTGFGGISTLLKHQCITVLYSSPAQMHDALDARLAATSTSPNPNLGLGMMMSRPGSPLPGGAPGTPGLGGTTNSTATATTIVTANGQISPPPRLAQWRTYRYFDEKEPTLGQWIVEASEDAEAAWSLISTSNSADESSGGSDGEDAEKNGARKEHPMEHTWMHLRWKLTARLECHYGMNSDSAQMQLRNDDDEEDGNGDGESASRRSKEDEEIMMWVSCAVCGKETRKRPLESGAWLLDFGKFLELLFYSNDLYRLSPPLCDHTTLPSSAEASSAIPEARTSIIRHFSRGNVSMALSMEHVSDIFDARIPRCQVTRSIAEVYRKEVVSPEHDEWVNAEKNRLRLDMTFCWKGLKDRLHWLEGLNNAHDDASTTSQKPSPATPPFSDSPENVTPSRRSSSAAPLRRQSTSSPPASQPPTAHSSMVLTRPTTSSLSQSSSTGSLSNLRELITNAEVALYKQLSQSSLDDLGEIRRAFITSASDAYHRLQSSTPVGIAADSNMPPDMESSLPDWWKPRTHCLPSSNVVVREAEWGSIVAFTLRSPEYRKELRDIASGPSIANSPGGRNVSGPKPPRAQSRPPVSMRRSVSGPITSVANLTTQKSSSGQNTKDEMMKQGVEDFTVTVSRKENPRDVTSLLSIREVLKHRRSFDTSSAPSRITAPSRASKYAGLSVPRGAWAKADVQVSMQNAGGEVTALGGAFFADVSGSNSSSGAATNSSNAQPGSSSLLTRPSATRTSTTATTASIVLPSVLAASISNSNTTSATTVPSSSDSEKEPSEQPSEMTIRLDPSSDASTKEADPATTDTAKTFTSTFTSALKYMMGPSSPRHPAESSSTAYDETIHRLALLGLDSGPSFPRIDSRPHIHYEFTVGNRLKFSCVSYYALQFSHLRKQCGVEDLLMRSLERTTGWIAEGGKSKASFFKTSDDRFILKTLVSAWHVSDLQVLLELSPSYFAYMTATQDKPTSLAKLLGFFSIEVRNLETGNIESKADILVMENLFWNHKPDAVYDLKGIRGRKSKSESPNKTMMDVDFMENQRRTPVYVGPRSKYVLQEALSSDAEFLATSNVMDYSLLLGVDHKNHKVICGLVDTFGTYNLAKTIESKAKHGLNSGKEKEITIVPPSEYQARFLKAMDRYFISIPDKWTKSVSSHPSSSEFFRTTHVL